MYKKIKNVCKHDIYNEPDDEDESEEGASEEFKKPG